MANITFTNNGGIETSGNIDAPSFSVNGKNLVSVVIEKNAVTDSNGERWYRLYSDGWLEQGGCVTVTLNEKDGEYLWAGTFLKTYTNPTYLSCQVIAKTGWAPHTFVGPEDLYNNEVSGFIRSDTGTFPRMAYVYWWVKGYTE